METLLFGLFVIGLILSLDEKCCWMPCGELFLGYKLDYDPESVADSLGDDVNTCL